MSTFLPIVENISQLTSKPSINIEPPPNLLNGLIEAEKVLHQEIVKKNSLTSLKTQSLPSLLTDGFDEEQIWQQLELQNKFAASHLGNLTGGILQNISIGKPSIDDEDDVSETGTLSDEYQDALSGADSDSNLSTSSAGKEQQPKSLLKKSRLSEKPDGSQSSDSEEEDDFNMNDSGDSDNEGDVKQPKSILKKPAASIISNKKMEEVEEGSLLETAANLLSKEVADEEEDDHSESIEKRNSDLQNSRKEKKVKQRKYKSVVDDQFFKLSKLEQFLRVEDLKEERSRDGESINKSDDEEEDTDEEDINLFEDIPSDDSDEQIDSEEETSNKKTSREIMYEDFFDAPDSGEDLDPKYSDSDENNEVEEPMDMTSDGELENDATNNEEAEPSKKVSKTPFELKQEMVKQQIEDYEEKMLKPAAWHLTGEVDAHKRPKDALLHLQTDFELNAKPVVVQDKPLCEKLESMLKNTIKNKAFSDGIRQYKTNDEIIAKKKEVFIEDTKSKKGLAQEYEDMYLKKKHGEEEVENPKHVEIKKLMDSIFPELHALFTHIPKPAIPDIKVVSNLPAISVEDVAPTSVSDVTLLAPEEVKKRTGVIKGKTERTDVDRKRERRKKKFLQKMKQKKREKEIGEKPLSAKAKKQEKLDLVKKLKQQRNTKFAKVDGQKVKSSKDFFERLQETVGNTESKKKTKKS